MMYRTRYEGVEMEAIVRQGDAMLAAEGLGEHALSDWIAEERARIEAERQARIRKPVAVGGVPLVIGEWYEVTVSKRWARKVEIRRACQFFGRAGGNEEALVFTVWPARALKGPQKWDTGKSEVWPISVIEAVKPIPEPTKIAGHIAVLKAEREERERRAIEYRALMEEASR